MPLLTHDETGATSMARAGAVGVAERPAARTGGGPGGGPPARPRSRWRRARKWVLGLLALVIVGPVLAFVIGWFLFNPDNLDGAATTQTATFTFSDGSPLAVKRPDNVNRVNVTLDKVPVGVQNAVLAAEDRTFRSNPGFDVLGIGRAVYSQLTGGSGGGSTITQQYVKNVTDQRQATLWRKYKEVVLAVKVSKEQTKDQILENYLNTIYFGRGANGIQAASQAYFGKDVGQLSVSEGALLAGVINSPTSSDPANSVERATFRWNTVLDAQVQAGWLDPGERAKQTFPATLDEAPSAGGVPGDDRYHIYERATAELEADGVSEDDLNTAGITITTTVDPAVQKSAVDAIEKTMDGQPANLREALVSIDPQTGAIRAYYGGADGVGTDYADGGVGRQPGSSFKPFVLAAALQADKGIGLGTDYDGSSGQRFPGKETPVVNSEGDSCSYCDVKTAMTKSINTVFYRIAVDIGPANVITAAHQAGIPDDMLTGQASGGIALGDQEVHPIDMASAYATFAADGVQRDPYIVSRVVAADGRVLFDRPAPPAGTQAMSQQVARNVTESMVDVPRSSRFALAGSRPAAAKTGTVQVPGDDKANKDTWTVGYTPQLSTAVWIGTDASDAVKTKSGTNAFGATLAAPIWQNFMNNALKGQPNAKFSDFEPIGPAPSAASSGTSGAGGPTRPSTPQTGAAPTPDNNGGNGGGNGGGDNGGGADGNNGQGDGSGNPGDGSGSSPGDPGNSPGNAQPDNGNGGDTPAGTGTQGRTVPAVGRPAAGSPR